MYSRVYRIHIKKYVSIIKSLYDILCLLHRTFDIDGNAMDRCIAEESLSTIFSSLLLPTSAAATSVPIANYRLRSDLTSGNGHSSSSNSDLNRDLKMNGGGGGEVEKKSLLNKVKGQVSSAVYIEVCICYDCTSCRIV